MCASDDGSGRHRGSVYAVLPRAYASAVSAIVGPAVLERQLASVAGFPGEALMQMFAELHADRATLCVVTHDPRWLERAQRRLYLFDGRVVPEPVA